MTPRFDDTLALLVQTVHGWPELVGVEAVTVVRDLRGRLHLVLTPLPGRVLADVEGLGARLDAALGAWFRGPVRSTTDGRSAGALAKQLVEKARGRWPVGWPVEFEDPVTGEVLTIQPGDQPRGEGLRWSGFQRLLAKEEWLSEQSASVPWPANKNTPLIVSFFSYKGGVGRSTLLSAVASLLVREGRHVVVVDLDLEAPGQSAIFDQRPEAGVVDYLLEHALTSRRIRLGNLLRDVTEDRIGAREPTIGSLRLVPAGRVGWSLLEKLARLDYLAGSDDGPSPVGAALRGLLHEIKALTPRPEFVLLDSRSGLHDLGGLSLHALAHVDVLVMRDDEQSRQGMGIALRALWQRTAPEELRVLMVEGMADAASDVLASPNIRLRDDLHGMFKDTVYSEQLDALPPPHDIEAPHHPYPMPEDSFLERQEKARSITADVLNRPWLHAIVDRLLTLVGLPRKQGGM